MFRNMKIVIENSRMFKQKYYMNTRNEKVLLQDQVQSLDKNIRTYREIEIVPEVKRKEEYNVTSNIVEKRTIECVIDLRRAGIKGNIVALNFANAMFPGGGYLLGGNAQEESLCRASFLYQSLTRNNKMYMHNRFHILPIYSDYIMYSHNVPVFRNDQGRLLDENVECSFITSPAVNRTFAKFMFSSKKINQIMERRIKKILSVAIKEDAEVIVLGAFGCGVFGNKREVILPMFQATINRYIPDHIKVIFAII